MAKIERIYNIPLRKQFRRAPSYMRAKRAIRAVRDFLQRHMKSKDIRLGPYLNMRIWEKGIKSPPHHVEVKVVKDDEGIVRAELIGMREDFLTGNKEEKKSKRQIAKEKAEEKQLAEAKQKEESKKTEDKKETESGKDAEKEAGSKKNADAAKSEVKDHSKEEDKKSEGSAKPVKDVSTEKPEADKPVETAAKKE